MNDNMIDYCKKDVQLTIDIIKANALREVKILKDILNTFGDILVLDEELGEVSASIKLRHYVDILQKWGLTMADIEVAIAKL